MTARIDMLGDGEFTFMGQSLRFAWEGDALELERVFHFADAVHARQFLDTLVSDERAWPVLRALLAACPHVEAFRHAAPKEALEVLALHLSQRTLLVVDGRARARRSPGRAKPKPPPPSKPVPPVAPATFIEIELVDQEGRPVPHERYRITLPDGTIRNGRLDDRGTARIDGIRPAGTCDVAFPDIDGREWGPSGTTPVFDQERDGIAKRHRANATDWIGRLAAQSGFRDPRTVWLHPANAELRAIRSPDILFQGDEVAIPVTVARDEPAATGTSHRYFVCVYHHHLRVRLHDHDDRPLAGRAYTLEVDGAQVVDGATTSSDGLVEQRVKATARTARIIVGDYAWELDLGALNPLADTEDDGVSGAQARLRNLGYDPGPIDGDFGPRTAAAVRWFQRRRGLPVTGGLDEATRTALYEALAAEHGC